MTTALDYALLAGAAYYSTRAEVNRFPIPDEWSEVVAERVADTQTGFEARTFQKGNEIVISFAGTDPNNAGLLTSPDGKANAALANGKWAEQLLQAAKYYLDIKAANPGATITLTGHSLGGGLAALVAVFFDVYAQTFDQAPFSKSALNVENNNAQDLRNRLAALGAPYSTSLAKLDAYIQLRDASTVNGYIPRQERVDTVRVEGEFLDGGLAGNKPFGNPQTVISHGPADWALSSFDLHSQALLTAFLQSEKTTLTSGQPDQTLSEVTKKLTPLLKMFFDKNLYAFDSAKVDPNFLDLIVRHEAGVKAGDNAGTAITADAMVTRFTKDLWKLAQGGLTQNDGNSNAQLAELSQALIAFAMQKYHTETAHDKELFTASEGSGSVSFTLNDVATSLGATKGKKYFDAYLAQSANGLSQADRETIAMQISKMEQWFVQASSDGMNATADSKTAFMLGGQGNDTMTGSNVADLLVGNQGDDVLSGGQGNDTLLGGTGLDTYNFTGASFGKDTVVDSDGLGQITLDGNAIGQTQGSGANQWKTTPSAGPGVTLSVLDDARSATGKVLRITQGEDTANSITINHFNLTQALTSTGYLGIKLNPDKKIAVKESTSGNVWSDSTFTLASLAGKTSSLVEGTAKTFTFYLNQAAKAGETITLALSALGDKFKAILGDSVVNANAAVITLVGGQTQVSFALVQQGDVTADASLQLSATYAGQSGSVTSNAWSVNLQDIAMQFKTACANPVGTRCLFDARVKPANERQLKVAA